jgi:hypothetical protein
MEASLAAKAEAPMNRSLNLGDGHISPDLTAASIRCVADSDKPFSD